MIRFTRWIFPGLLALLPLLTEPAMARGLSGSYLAATRAEIANDYAQASKYYVRALALDPQNPEILRGALTSALGKGDMTTAFVLAKRYAKFDADAVLPHLVLLIQAVEAGQFDRALAELDQTDDEFGQLLSGTARGWVLYGLGDVEGAIAAFQALNQNGTLVQFGQHHLAMMLAMDGQADQALNALNNNGDPVTLFASSFMLRADILAGQGRKNAAISALDNAARAGFAGAELDAMRAQILAGDPRNWPVQNASDGLAELLYQLGTVYRDEGTMLPVLYARLAQYMRSDHAETVLLVADLMEMRGQYDLANAALSQISRDAPQFLDAEANRAAVLERNGREVEAIGVLNSLTRIAPDNLNSHFLLGEAFRRQQNFVDAVNAYDAAIALEPEPREFMWRVFYGRAVAKERLKNWPEAEADFRTSLSLSPDQPIVLNYLGYSLLEMGLKLPEANEMIERAVAQRPESGAIVDSLAWGLYLQGRFEEALPHQEKAVELMPTDPIVNEHLGDIYWQLGRKREARFQWRRALSFDPEAERIPKIEQKLRDGIEPDP